ncbi:hypothetical protein G6556_19040, partial [Cellulomonas sp. IC4_254]|nr:hypothetical protein [Cellulomonas sp. IC4_254]
MSAAATTAPARQAGPGAAPTTRRRRGGSRIVFLLPAALFLGLFSLYPLVQLVRMAVSQVTAATLNAD